MIRSSGSEEVDALWGVNFSGNIIPAAWYKTVVRPNGKAHLMAINILADIVYWYRPAEIRDEATGYIIGIRKKFRSDILQKSYQYYIDLFGASRGNVKSAFDLLEDLGVIRRELRDKVGANGTTQATNIMFIHLNTEVLKALTFPESEKPDDGGRKEVAEQPGDDPSEETFVPVAERESAENKPSDVLPVDEQGILQNLKEDPTKFVASPYKKCSIPLQNLEGDPPKNGGTYTENTTKTTGENTPETILESPVDVENSVLPSVHLSDRPVKLRVARRTEGQTDRDPVHTDKTEKQGNWELKVREQIQYDWLLKRHPYDREIIDILCRCIADTLAFTVPTMRINGAVLPYDAVRTRFLQLDVTDIEHLVARLKQTTSKIRSSRNYLLTALYNARDDAVVQAEAEARNSMAGGAG